MASKVRACCRETRPAVLASSPEDTRGQPSEPEDGVLGVDVAGLAGVALESAAPLESAALLALADVAGPSLPGLFAPEPDLA